MNDNKSVSVVLR